MVLNVKEVPIEEAVKVNRTVSEFDEETRNADAAYFEERYKDKDPLIVVCYVDEDPAGYLIGYNRDDDGVYYCYMAGVNPSFRRLGVLTALMDYEDEWAKNKGYKAIRVRTWNNRRSML